MQEHAHARPSPVRLHRLEDGRRSGGRLAPGIEHSRVRPGVYAARDEWEALPPWDRYLARVHAYAKVNPDAIFAFESSAALRGLPVFGEPRDIHVYSARRSTSLRFGDVLVHTSESGRSIDRLGPFLVTAIPDTLVDLGRALPPAFGLAVVDAALRARSVLEPRQIARAAATQTNLRGTRRLAWVVSRADARSESVGESVSRAVIEWCGFEPPELQHEFPHPDGVDRSDFYWPSVDTVGESDGYGKYRMWGLGAMPERLIAEKQREDRIRRRVRGFTRWDWGDMMQWTRLDDRLRRAGIPVIRHPDHTMLSTLARNPRSFVRETR